MKGLGTLISMQRVWLYQTIHVLHEIWQLTQAHRRRVIVVFPCECLSVCLSVCLLPFDLQNCKVVLHFEHMNRKLLLRMPGKTSLLF